MTKGQIRHLLILIGVFLTFIMCIAIFHLTLFKNHGLNDDGTTYNHIVPFDIKGFAVRGDEILFVSKQRYICVFSLIDEQYKYSLNYRAFIPADDCDGIAIIDDDIFIYDNRLSIIYKITNDQLVDKFRVTVSELREYHLEPSGATKTLTTEDGVYAYNHGNIRKREAGGKEWETVFHEPAWNKIYAYLKIITIFTYPAPIIYGIIVHEHNKIKARNKAKVQNMEIVQK